MALKADIALQIVDFPPFQTFLHWYFHHEIVLILLN